MAQVRVKVINNRMKVRAYITHKQSEKYSDCADYFGICPPNKRVAVSDGVSQSIMPLEWAKILVNAFINNNWDPETGVSSLQSEWFKEANAYLNDQRVQGNNPWMLENCITNRDGAGATFCGIEFLDDSRWKAKILGDSCLVLLDENNEILEIVSSKDGKFDNRPDYFDSFKEQRGTVKTKEGELKGHKILLVSDPFSELFQNYQTSVEVKDIIDKILSLSNYNSYIQLVDEYRKLYHMHNDDSTLVIIEYDKKAEFDILEEFNLDLLQENEIKAEEDKKKEAKKDEIEEQDDWENASSKNSLESYSYYLNKYPQGKHSKEAEIRIENIKKSSGAARENGQNDPSEPSSEDDDRYGRVDNNTKNSSLHECNMDNNPEISSTTPDPTSGEEGTEPTRSTSSEESNSTATKIEVRGILDKKEVANLEKIVKQDEIIVPNSVDSSDGIDMESLFTIAIELFKKHRENFRKAFARKKWSDEPEECFKKFWYELKEIIDNSNG